ncbi:hypothetical protein ACFT8W_14715 [Streptomyces hygroscopicus]|uniref:hypothetical protein n=1 Tax=Streptomyces hygroscopicus TaxID=1912 RepID=UPI00363B5376
MSITRRPLGHGSQPQPPAAAQLETGSVRRMSVAEADINAALLYRPGGLEHLAQRASVACSAPRISPPDCRTGWLGCPVTCD